MLFQRWIVWAVIALLYSLACLGGTLSMLVLVSLLVWQALREYVRLVDLPPHYHVALFAFGLAMGPLAVWDPNAFFTALPLLLIVATLLPLLTQDVGHGMKCLALAVLGFGYLPLLLAHLLLIHAWLPGGPLDGEREILHAISAPSEQAVRERLAQDNWAQNGMLSIKSVEPWTILLDGRGG